jgi:cyclase
MLRAGADKISLNSAAVRSPNLITQGAEEFGSQAVVVAIDARRKGTQGNSEELRGTQGNSPTRPLVHSPTRLLSTQHSALSTPSWEVVINGGRVTTGLDVVQWAIEAEQRGAGEILLTSMDADGTKAGYDIALTRAVANAVNIPVIASGGAGRVEHFAEALTEGGAAAALAASLFHFNELRIRDVKAYLREKGIAVRASPVG